MYDFYCLKARFYCDSEATQSRLQASRRTKWCESDSFFFLLPIRVGFWILWLTIDFKTYWHVTKGIDWADRWQLRPVVITWNCLKNSYYLF